MAIGRSIGLVFYSVMVLCFLFLAGYGIVLNVRDAVSRTWGQLRTTANELGIVFRFFFPDNRRKWREQRKEQKLRSERLGWVWAELKRDLLDRAKQQWWLFAYAAIAASSAWMMLFSGHSTWSTAYGWSVFASTFALLVIWIPSWLPNAPGAARLILAIFMTLIPLGLLLGAYVRLDQGTLSLSYSVIALTYVLVPLILIIKVVLDESKSPWAKAAVGFFGYFGAFIYTIWLLGLYFSGKQSLSLPLSQHLVGVFTTGAKNTLGYEDGPGLAPLVSQQIGFLLNTVTVGFFVSYSASLIYTEFQSRKEAAGKHNMVTEESGSRNQSARDSGFQVLLPNTSGDCPGRIKGFVTAKGNRYFVTPDMRQYHVTKAVYCFETEQDALNAGFTKSNH